MKFANRIASVILAGSIAIGATACGAVTLDGKNFPIPGSGGTATQSAPLATTKIDVAAATQKLETIAVKGKAPKTGYSRDEFGAAWSDVDHNGCDTRNDILKRDLTNVVFKDGTKQCVVASGTLADDYTGKTINFVRGPESAKVQIDHMIPLSESWQKGAQQWTPEKRLQFANDPINLKAVDGPSNGSKSDSDLSAWLPPNKGEWCDYTARIIDVKAKYGVWMIQAEHDKAAEILSTCK